MCVKMESSKPRSPPAGGARCVLPGGSEENPMSLPSGLLAGNASGVGQATQHCCVKCGLPVVRINPHKPWPIRCTACKKAAAREYALAYRARTRPRVNWGNLTCKRCGQFACTVPRRGRPSKWCRDCLRSVRTEQERVRKARRNAEGKDKPHRGQCLKCGIEFQSGRKGQKYCGQACCHLASRSRSIVSCHQCGKEFETCSARSSGRRFCSKACFHALHCAPLVQCQHCGKDFKKKAYTTPWHGKNKFCSRECSYTHRWGEHRPRKATSPEQMKRCSQKARMTTLKHRCKHYVVPFDPNCTREAVCGRDNWKCQNCGIKCHQGPCRINKRTRKVSRRNAEHDHIIPLATGPGSPGNVFSNSQCLCRRCNGRKGKKPSGQMLIAAFAEP